MAVARQDAHSPNRGGGKDDRNGYDPWAIEPMPADLIDSPLDFIFAEHYRQREAAAIVVMIADGEFDRAGVQSLLAFLQEDFALHIGDEEVVLFPILRQRCLPEDNIDRILQRLQDEHREDESISDEAIEILKAGLNGQPLSALQKSRLRVFAEHILQHLALENGVLLPIARVRLNADDLKILADMLRSRRQPANRKAGPD